MRKWCTAGICLLFVGCVASAQVKEASSQVGVALDQLRAAQRELRDLYLHELDETRRIVGRAIVADAVVNKVGRLSEDEVQGNLLTISSAIKDEREAYRATVESVLEIDPGLDQPDDDALLDGVLSGRAADLRAAAAELEAAGATESAAELRIQADALDTAGADIDQREDLLTLITLARTKRAVRSGLADLDAYIRFLQLIHNQVHEWVSTDVSVSGAEVAALIEKAQAEAAEPEGGER